MQRVEYSIVILHFTRYNDTVTYRTEIPFLGRTWAVEQHVPAVPHHLPPLHLHSGGSQRQRLSWFPSCSPTFLKSGMLPSTTPSSQDSRHRDGTMCRHCTDPRKDVDKSCSHLDSYRMIVHAVATGRPCMINAVARHEYCERHTWQRKST